MIKPNPYKLICSKCGYSKVVSPKSDVLSPIDLIAMNSICPKCKGQMEKNNLNIIDEILTLLKVK